MATTFVGGGEAHRSVETRTRHVESLRLESKGLAVVTFARLAKLVAVLLVVVALWEARPPAPPARVVVLALPGASLEQVAGEGGVLQAGPIVVPPSTTGVAFWRRLFSFELASERDPVDPTPLWGERRSPVRALFVPARLFDPDHGTAAADRTFVGSSSGLMVEAADIAAGRIPFPYDRATDAIASTAATLSGEEWSTWITLPETAGAAHGAVAQFQFVRFTDTAFYFSPVYVATGTASSASPFFRGLERELRPLVALHSIELSRRRWNSLGELFDQENEQRMAVIFDGVAEDSAAVFSPDSTPVAVSNKVRDTLASGIAVIRTAVGPDVLIVMVGGPSTGRPKGEAPWYVILGKTSGSFAESAGAGAPLDFDAIRAVVLHAAGVSLDAREKMLLPALLTVRYPNRATLARLPAEADTREPAQRWSAATLESVRAAAR